ncbi:MAG: outer membrane beta-barrel protein [Ferruginibacter sp.]|nr:outer membrane beta-barrel protein [Ferruginibacter sp.]
MIRFLGFFLTFNLFVIAALAQNSTIKGIVRDDKTPVQGATVVIYLQRDSSQTQKASTVTDRKGAFDLVNIDNDSYFIEISSIGYEMIKKELIITGENKELGTIQLLKMGKDLEGVVVVSQAPAVIQKGDTSQFSASQFKVNPDATTEDLIKKMPGITVDKDGTVTAQGEQVKKVTIDGKDFFGDDASAALKNLPSEVVDKIQVFDRLSDQAQLTGFDDGNSVKALNIVTKSGIKNGQFGRLYTGYGTDDRYSAGGNISFFKGNRRISLVGNFNNINQQNFGSQDLLGLTSSGGRGGGGGGRGGGGWGGGGGGADNFSVGQSSGISKTNAFGINYSDQWGKKLNITGSYFFNNSTNNNSSVVNTETLGDKKQFSLQNSVSNTENNNHRFNMRLEYKIDSNNSIFIIPSINFQNNNSRTPVSSLLTLNAFKDSVNSSIANSMADRSGYNIRNNIMYRHSFAKKGRTLSLGFNTAYTKNDGESIIDARYRFYDSLGFFANDSMQNQFTDNATNGYTYGANIAYTEPIGKKGQLQFDYTPSVQKNKADQQTYLFDGIKYSKFDTILSNRFDNTITTNNAGISYRLGQSRDEQLSFGVNFQNSKLESQRVFPTSSSVNQSFTNILPNVMWRKKLNASTNIRLFYRASTNFPSVNQLQDVVNLTNPLRVSSGNPDLKQSYTHFLAGRYMYTNSKTSRSFFANLFLQTASDYISNATYIANKDSIIQQKLVLKEGSQLTKPVNLDGYKSLRTFFTYSLPVKVIKTTVNLNAGFSYAKLPGLANYRKTTTNNYTYNTGIVFASNISEYVDFNLSYSANFSNAQTISLRTTSNSKYVNQATGLQLNLLSKKGWFVQNDVSNQIYSGLTDGFNQSYWLWNAAIGKKFGKKKAAELKLSVFDLLKQNQSIVRTVTGAYIEDSQSEVLQQYFMLTFSYSLKNFGVAARPANGGFNQNREGMMRPGGMNPSF